MIYNDLVYGKQEIKEPVILELIKTKAMQRLKGINQGGLHQSLTLNSRTNRFTHSVGVFLLLRNFNAPLEEKIAGLLHDISHTVFSHALDFYFNTHTTHDYHEKYHEEIIMNSKIPLILKKHNINLDYILNEKNFPLLENEIPDICADRIDYFLRDMVDLGKITRKQANRILSDGIIVHKNEFIFNNLEDAKFSAMNYIKANEMYWSNPLQCTFFQLTSEIAKIAFDNKIINQEDFFKTDKEFVDKLLKSKNNEILNKWNLLKNLKVVEDKKNYDYHLKTKPRHIDPKILINGSIKRLSELDVEFKERLDNYLKKMNDGFYIRINNM